MDSTIPRVLTAAMGAAARSEKDSLPGAGDFEGTTSPDLFASLLGGLNQADISSSEGESAGLQPSPAETGDSAVKADHNLLWQQVLPLFTPLPLDPTPAKLGLDVGDAANPVPDVADADTAENESVGRVGEGPDFGRGDGVTAAQRVHDTAGAGVALEPSSEIVDELDEGFAQTGGQRMPFRGASTSSAEFSLPRELAPLRAASPAAPWRAVEPAGQVPLLPVAGEERAEGAAGGFEFSPTLAVETGFVPPGSEDSIEPSQQPVAESEEAELGVAFAVVEGDVKSAETTLAAGPSRAPLAQPEGHRLDSGSEQRRAFFAARSGASQVALDRSVEPAVSNSLKYGAEEVTNDQRTVGTRVAKLVPDVTRATPVQVAATFLSPGDSPVQQGGAVRGDVFPEAEAEAVSAGRAVEAATKVIESMAGSEQRVASSVVLRFKIGSDDLAVRIGMVDGQPTAEFHTHSVEVREAVLREWQASIPADSPLRVREPVFVSGFSADSREGQPRQQEGRSSGRPQREEFAALPQAAAPRVSREQPRRSRAEAGASSSGILSVFA